MTDRPIRADTITGVFASQVARQPDALCAAMGERRATYAELDAASLAVAQRLVGMGVEPGDRVAILLPNRFDWFQLFFGIARTGGVQVPINPYLKGEFLAYQLTDCDPAVLVVDEAGARAVEPLLERLPALRAVVLLDGGSMAAPTGVRKGPWEEFEPSGEPLPEVSPSSLASILYTSGTTGMPKGCMLPHGYYARVGQIENLLVGYRGDDVFFTAMPLFHGGAQLKIFMACIEAGIPAVFEETFSPKNYIAKATEAGATFLNGVAAMGTMLLTVPAADTDRGHRIRVANIAPMSVANQEEFGARYGVDVWAETYGQTECVPVMASPVSGPRDRASIGRAVPDVEVALLDDNGVPVARGEVGEICLRPRHRFAMFAGYWRKPEDTLAAFSGLWYHTGDCARQIESGAFVFADRKKDSMRRRGENVSSLELEAALVRHPRIDAVAVHAIASDLGEDEIKACIVTSEPTEIQPRELFAWFQAHLPYFAIPRYVEFVDEIPVNHLGRVQKFLLRERGVTASTWDFEALGLAVGRTDRR